MNSKVVWLGLVLSVWLAGCADTRLASGLCIASTIPTATIVQSGRIQCEASLQGSCELSAVIWIDGENGAPAGTAGDRLIFGNDKAPLSRHEASVFSVPFDGKVFDPAGAKTFYAFPPFSRVSKFEAMSVTPDGRHVIAMNAFDRFSSGDSSQDKYNTLLAWPAHLPAQAQVLARTERDGVSSSGALRALLAQTLQNHFGPANAYFKLEGVALLPQGRIVFGVRELGRSYADFDYRAILIAGGYRITGDRLDLDPATELRVVGDFSGPGGVSAQVGRAVGLSSIEYDAAGKRLLMLTTFETAGAAGAAGAYLWILPDRPDGSLGATPLLVRDVNGAPFLMTHKAEGLAVLDAGRVFVIHDDDRLATPIATAIANRMATSAPVRQPNEAAFDILQLSAGNANQAPCR